MIRVAEFNSAVELVAWLAGQQQMILAVAPGNEPARVNPALCDQILPHGLCPAFGELLIVFGAPHRIGVSIYDDVEPGDVGRRLRLSATESSSLPRPP